MKKLTVLLGIVTLMSSCGIQFGDYNRWRQVHGNKGMCQNEVEEVEEMTQEEFYSSLDCENCDEID
jgi:hypothetical protein